MERHKPIEYRGALAVACEPERHPASRLEAAELAPQLVALLLSEVVHVGLEAVGKGQSWRADEAIEPHLVAGAAEARRESIQCSGVLGNELEDGAGRSPRGDPSGERLRDDGHIHWLRDDVLVVGVLAAREGNGAVVLKSERGDAAFRDPKRDLLAAVVCPRYTDPVRREKDIRVGAKPGQLGPFGLERRRVARDTDRVGRGQDHPSLGEYTFE